MLATTLCHYRVDSKIGEGGMGVVYKARDTKLGRTVAIKVLPPEKVTDPERKRRFIQEAKAASALNHPNIVTVFDVSADQGMDFIVMEFVPGKTLEQLIGRKPAPLETVLKYAMQVADALAAAHSAGIIHRDLKPGNVMVNEEGLVKVLDFGLAKLAETSEVTEWDGTKTIDAHSPRSRDGVIMGTASYMSPEQVEGRKLDPRSDVFAFGAMLYEMLTGRRAFQGEGEISTLASIIHQEPRPIRDLTPGIPTDLETIVLRCMRKNPARRFQSMADVKAALLDLLEARQSGSLSPSVSPPQPARGRLHRLVFPAAALVLLGAAVWFLRPAPQLPPPDPLPFTTDAGREFNPTFSPDGNSVAYTWNGERRDNYDLYVRVIGTTSALRVTTDPEPDVYPAWSPDGRTLAFIRRPGVGHPVIMIVPPLGGHERRIGETGGFGSICWSADGAWIFHEDRISEQTPESLFAVSVETGERKKLLEPLPESRGDRDPALSPDGRTLAFVRTLASGQGDLYVAPIHGITLGTPRRVTFTGQITSRPVWLPDGSELVVVGGVLGNPVLQRVPVSGKSAPVRMGYAGEMTDEPAISRDGRRLAFTRIILDSNIWRARVAERAQTKVQMEEFFASTRLDFNPQYSPDGKRVVFSSNRTGSFEVWIADADGTSAIPITSFGAARAGSPRWSPDGERIVFDCNVEGEPRIYQVRSSGGKPWRVENTGDAAVPSFSRDGKWIYFGSHRTGRNEIWKVPANGGNAVQVTRHGGYTGFETPDGKSLCFTTSDAPVPVKMISLADPDREKTLFGPIVSRAFAVTHDGIWYISMAEDEPRHLRFYPFAGGATRTAAEIERPISWGMSVSPDGGSLLFSQVDHSGSDLMLINNFH